MNSKMTRVGLLGYGKMGKAIDQLAAQHQVEIVWRTGRNDRALLTPEFLNTADVVIEFSRPEAGYDNVMLCLNAGVPVVSGTTGWQNQLEDARQACNNLGGAFIWASNFSVGVNLFFEINRVVTRLMAAHPGYDAALTEIHHIHKLDAPSGTGVSLAEDLIAASSGRYSAWAMEQADLSAEVLPLTAIREGEVPGTHLITWNGANDAITIEHKAHNRNGFASGALIAARWLAGKKGLFTMKDVLGL